VDEAGGAEGIWPAPHLPGGPGSAEFLPFCANVITKYAVPKDMVVAELVAPVWDKQEALGLVWPSRVFRSASAKFTSEEFVTQ